MSSLCERLSGEGELLKFSDTEPIQALQAILEGRPEVIVLERLFAATPRGAALINRIRTDPNLGQSEVRVMSHTGDYMRQVARPAAAAGAGPGVAVDTGSPGGPGVAVASQAPPAATAETTSRAARLARHAPRPENAVAARRRDSARWQSGRRDRRLDGRRASRFQHDPAAESEGARLDSAGGRARALSRDRRLGEVRAAEAVSRRRSTAPVSSSSTRTTPRSTSSAPAIESTKNGRGKREDGKELRLSGNVAD